MPEATSSLFEILSPILLRCHCFNTVLNLVLGFFDYFLAFVFLCRGLLCLLWADLGRFASLVLSFGDESLLHDVLLGVGRPEG